MNELKRADEFRAVLARYKPSADSLKTLNRIKLVLLTAPTAGGRNTIIDRLVAIGQYHFVVSDTTRQPRVNNGTPEQNGREYWFRTEEDFLDDLQHGAYLEAELIHNQQVSGISIRELERARSLDRIAINEVDMRGIANVLPSKPDTIGILILPPSFDEWLRRVDARGEMPPIERRRRFESAAEIYRMAMNGTYPIIINDKLDDAVRKVDHLARLNQLDEPQSYARKIAQELYRATLDYLATL